MDNSNNLRIINERHSLQVWYIILNIILHNNIINNCHWYKDNSHQLNKCFLIIHKEKLSIKINRINNYRLNRL